jgi:molybdopterin-guanine dinucleotide biosynthesis protein A
MTGAPLGDVPPDEAVPFHGAVLCGGASRRMGTDKAQLELDGRPLARRVADALVAAGARSVVAIGGDEAGLARLGLAVVPDAHPGEGPLGAILTALEVHAQEDVLVVVLACDLVDPDASAIRAVVAHGQREEADVAMPVVDGRRHLHHAVWHTRARHPLRAAFDAGERAPKRAIATLRVAEVPGIAARSVRDVDDPAALAAVRRQRATRPAPDRAG